MTSEETKSIQDIQGTGGFRVMQNLIQQRMDKLDSVREIDKQGLVAEQALARQLAYEVLAGFLQEINLLNINDKNIKRTYE